MQTIRRGADRGHADHGWLRSAHSFSFASYHDPRHMGFGSLRVINEDRVAPGKGFGTHAHRDMEIISYVLSGELEHRDSMGNGSVIRPGDVQRMSAGTGITHSEFNPSPDSATHFLQIWIEPAAEGTRPDYEQAHFDAASRQSRLRAIIAPDGRDGALRIGQDVSLYAGLLDVGDTVSLSIADGRRAYVHLARGSARVNGERLDGGDAMLIDSGGEIRIDQAKQADVLVFDLA